MQKMFQPDDHRYIRQSACDDNSRSVENDKKREMIEHAQAKANQRMAASEKRKNAAERADRVAAVQLIFDKEKITALKGQALKDIMARYISVQMLPLQICTHIHCRLYM